MGLYLGVAKLLGFLVLVALAAAGVLLLLSGLGVPVADTAIAAIQGVVDGVIDWFQSLVTDAATPW
ncbi:hypothetical protein [Halocalculus aciditolerans]|uniref:Uncharacterized protein n=1 Tax=Halocalculus aciditolerans TaxID=1383812 RepID=A0A830FGP1_9EURY|nr:hypothetical protein [Halocalculus aciditolerans]GGL73729.1 hypothetical protein GCM10009039_34800 [Halocalculus aciditolerans]